MKTYIEEHATHLVDFQADKVPGQIRASFQVEDRMRNKVERTLNKPRFEVRMIDQSGFIILTGCQLIGSDRVRDELWCTLSYEHELHFPILKN